jgi:serine/threonine protein phosphatase 1
MDLTYAVADLHGRFDLLQAGIETIVAHAGGRSATVVTLGDYIDRGPDSCQVIEKLRQWKLPHLRLVALKGNHEVMLCDVVAGRAEEGWWRHNGGEATLRSYQQSQGRAANTRQVSTSDRASGDDRVIFESRVGRGQARQSGNSVHMIPRADVDWLNALPLMHIDQHRIFVHAGLDHAVPLDQQSTQALLWKRYGAAERDGYGHYHVVHGHDGTLTGPVLRRNRTNLDCLAWRSGILTVGVFANELPGGPTEFLTVTAAGG